MPDQTMHQAAKELREAVVALKELINREYPSRGEVEARFQSKQNAQNRMIFVILTVLCSFILSFFATVGTVSTCFLGDGTQHPPHICSMLPGYNDTIRNNKVILRQFQHLIKVTESNDHRLDRLEKTGR